MSSSTPSAPLLDPGELTAPLLVCDAAGSVQTASPAGLALLRRLAGLRAIPGPLPEDLWRQLARTPSGEAVQWRPPGDGASVLGCTRYAHGERFVVLLKEISQMQAALSRRLHRERLEATGRLVASVAHELRNAVASIDYCADYLRVAGPTLSGEAMDEATGDILAASRRLQGLVDGLLDFARIGPSVAVPVSLREVLNRAQGFLRGVLRKGDHRLGLQIGPEAAWVQGNSLVIEQIVVNLVLNAVRAAEGPARVRVIASRRESRVQTLVWDDGPGIDEALRGSVFEPFFTTHADGTGLGLTNAREAAESMGGELVLLDRSPGACFALTLPAAAPPLE